MTSFTKKRDTYTLDDAEIVLGKACKGLGYKGVWMRTENSKLGDTVVYYSQSSQEQLFGIYNNTTVFVYHGKFRQPISQIVEGCGGHNKTPPPRDPPTWNNIVNTPTRPTPRPVIGGILSRHTTQKTRGRRNKNSRKVGTEDYGSGVRICTQWPGEAFVFKKIICQAFKREEFPIQFF